MSTKQKNRRNNKPLPRIADEFYRRENRRRLNDKRPRDNEELYDMIGYLQRSYRHHNLVDMLLDAYNRGDFNMNTLYDAVSALCHGDDRYMDRMWGTRDRQWRY